MDEVHNEVLPDVRTPLRVDGMGLPIEVMEDLLIRRAAKVGRAPTTDLAQQLHVSVNETGENRVAIRLSKDSSRPLVARRDALDRLASLARRIGASATFGEPIVISLPMQGRARGTSSLAEHEVPGDAIGLGVAETSHNLRRSREDDHGQANVL